MNASKLLRGTALALGLLGASCGQNNDPPVATDLNLEQFQGKWFEIAHLPRPTQRDCTGTIATYTRQPDGTFNFAHECTLTNGAYYGATLVASIPDTQTPSKLAVDFGGFKGDYWVLEVASDYRYAVVGHPSRDYLWILSRTPTLAAADQDTVLAHAKSNGFDTTQLQYTPPGPAPVGTPDPPVTYGVGGCAAALATRYGRTGFASLIVVALGLAVRRRRRR